jgi:hypothetical protein
MIEMLPDPFPAGLYAARARSKQAEGEVGRSQKEPRPDPRMSFSGPQGVDVGEIGTF